MLLSLKVSVLSTLLIAVLLAPVLGLPQGEYDSWSLAEAVSLLNDSSWARQETFTRVLGGVGSGIQGEKEIYSTFFVRFLSASPIRQAYARIKLIHLGYEQLRGEAKRELRESVEESLDLDVRRWIVVAVAFRSNIPRTESSIDQFFQSQTVETLRDDAFLSTTQFPKLELHAYFPPREESVGAKFVFPRSLDGVPVVRDTDETVVFELDVPGFGSQLRATFMVNEMILEGQLVL
jgi:hypothetical protein